MMRAFGGFVVLMLVLIGVYGCLRQAQSIDCYCSVYTEADAETAVRLSFHTSRFYCEHFKAKAWVVTEPTKLAKVAQCTDHQVKTAAAEVLQGATTKDAR